MLKENVKIKKLREKINEKEREETLAFDRFLRKISIYFTFLLAKTNVSANQITFFMLLTGFLAGLFFYFENFLLGIVLMQFWYILDCVDGEIARLKKQCSMTGLYYDHIIHYINHPIFFIGLSYGLYKEIKWQGILLFGFLAAFFNLIDRAAADSYTMVLYKNIIKNHIYNYNEDNIIDHKNIFNKIKEKVIQFLHFPAIMNFFTISILVDYVLKEYEIYNHMYITVVVMIGYGVFIPLKFIILICRQTNNYKIDKKYNEITKK